MNDHNLETSFFASFVELEFLGQDIITNVFVARGQGAENVKPDYHTRNVRRRVGQASVEDLPGRNLQEGSWGHRAWKAMCYVSWRAAVSPAAVSPACLCSSTHWNCAVAREAVAEETSQQPHRIPPQCGRRDIQATIMRRCMVAG